MAEEEVRLEGESLEDYSRKLLENGREGWDLPHTNSVVHHVGELAQAVGLDVRSLTAAARLHDTGYGEIRKGEGSAAVLAQKPDHQVRGAAFAREFLERPENLDRYSAEQRELIIRIVANHDKLSELDPADLNSVVFMEADTLGMIDISRATPTFNRTDGLRFIAGVRTRRAPLFQTELGKKRLAELLPKAEAYFENLPE